MKEKGAIGKDAAKRKINSRSKGARGEREFAEVVIRTFGVEARRGRQYCGSPDSPDVQTGFKRLHFECKRVESFNLYKAMKQAENDAGDKIPVVAHRRNNQPWVVCVKLDDVLDFCREILENANVQEKNR